MFEPLRRYAEMGAALCPIAAGTKDGYLIGSWAHDWSKDPAQWLAWSKQFPGCNWIMVAGPSGKIVVDIDVKKVGQEVAWQTWVDWCEANNSPVLMPQIFTPSQGWHIYLDTAETIFNQPALVKGIIDIRAGKGYVLIPPSQVNGAPYAWLI
jgi:hypothetical protein